ncbi:MAG: hypothetical protein ABJA93_11345 [Sporichthyaceae bacterium]
MSLGYSTAAVVAAKNAGGVSAEYALARSLALVTVAIVPIAGERREWLLAAAVAMILVQALDAVIGRRIHDTLKTIGPAVTAAVNLALLAWYLRS